MRYYYYIPLVFALLMISTYQSATLTCSQNDLMTCLSPVVEYILTPGGQKALEILRSDPEFISGEQLINLCSVGHDLMTCLESSLDQCIKEPDVKRFNKGLVSLTERCNETGFTENAKKYLSCGQKLSETNPQVRTCQNDWLIAVGAGGGTSGLGTSVLDELTEWRTDNKLRKFCSAQEKYYRCSIADIQSTCGSEVGNIAKSLQDAIFQALHCNRSSGFHSSFAAVMLMLASLSALWLLRINAGISN